MVYYDAAHNTQRMPRIVFQIAGDSYLSTASCNQTRPLERDRLTRAVLYEIVDVTLVFLL
jgi:hypothetical protein